MGYSAAASTAIASASPAVRYKLELKPQGSGSWTEFAYTRGSLSITEEEDRAKELSAELINSSLNMSSEVYPTSYTAIGTKVRVTSYVETNEALGTLESRVEFLGEIISVAPADYRFSIRAYCDQWISSKALARVTNSIAPTELAVVPHTPRRQLSKLDAQYGEAYGFVPDGSGTDRAFDKLTQLIRRPWSDQGLRVWAHPTDTYYIDTLNGATKYETYELEQGKWRVDYRSGALSIVEALPPGRPSAGSPTPPNAYWVEGVGVWVETLLGAFVTTNTKNADFARFFEAMFLFPSIYCGMGLTLGTEWGNAITAVNTGAKRFTIAGDFTAWYTATSRIYVQSSTGNNGSYSIASVSLSGGNTLIVVNEAVPSATGDGYITLDSGLDMPATMPYDLGSAQNLLSSFYSDFQRNVRPVFDDDSGRWWLRVITQKTAGSCDWTLYHAKSIDQSREQSNLYTAVLLTGKKTRPTNLFETEATAGKVTDISSAGDWFIFNGDDIEKDGCSFDVALAAAYDGLGNTGMGLHNLAATPDVDPGTDPISNKYAGWYKMKQGELDPGQPIRRIEFTAGHTRNENAKNGHQGYFWPGYRLQVSDDGIIWYDCTPLMYGVYEPDSDHVIELDQIARRYGLYWRLLGSAFNWGDSALLDPACVIQEFRLFQDTEYEALASISPMHAVTARVTGAGGSLSCRGDLTKEFSAGDTFTLRNNANAGSNGSYTVASVAYNATTDVSAVTVTGTIPVGTTVSGEFYSTTNYRLLNGNPSVKRDYPDLWDRFGGKLRAYTKNLGDKYNEQLAKQDAILLLDDFIKLFQRVSYVSAVPDPRPRLYDSVLVVDDINGNVTTLLITQVTKTDTSTTVSGINYRSGPLGS